MNQGDPEPAGSPRAPWSHDSLDDSLETGYSARMQERLNEVEHGKLSWTMAFSEFAKTFRRDGCGFEKPAAAAPELMDAFLAPAAAAKPAAGEPKAPKPQGLSTRLRNSPHRVCAALLSGWRNWGPTIGKPISLQALTRRASIAALLAMLFGAGSALAQQSLHWRALDVKARLDADGKLHVVERHAMVFTGDWNGGERSFRLFPGQTFSFEGIRRIDPATGAVTEQLGRDLKSGSLDEVDRYAFTDATTLRWRSRLPSDPPFENTEIGYEISYTLSGVLLKQGATYVLDHNFGLPEAEQRIETLSVDLDLDPAWAAPAGFTRHRSTGRLPPGSDFVVHAELTRPDGGSPSGVRTGTSRSTRLAFFGALLAAVLVLAFGFYSRESSLGRFGSSVPPGSIDAAWLEKRLFSLAPEEAGALWDDTVGAPEVTAVLARLTAEAKIETSASAKELTMRLKAPLGSFAGYDKELLEALFFSKRTETSTAEIKSHYERKGFDPAATIRPGLLDKLSAHPDFRDRSGRPVRWPTFLLFTGGSALLVLEAVRGQSDWGTILGLAISSGFWWALGLVGASFYQRRMDRLLPWALSFGFVPLLFLRGAWRSVEFGGLSPLLVLVGLLLLRLAILSNIFNVAKTREGPKKIARRKELVAARRFFKRELAKPKPQMKDSWFPWVVAFGLGPAVDRWFRSFGGAASAVAVSRSVSGSSSAGSGSFAGDTGGFTGGGGSFGGGGSSGAWAVAAGTLASGVATPGSGGGGSGGGSGGGGSSGGGGGGGW